MLNKPTANSNFFIGLTPSSAKTGRFSTLNSTWKDLNT